jgi:hypothetical protein
LIELKATKNASANELLIWQQNIRKNA